MAKLVYGTVPEHPRKVIHVVRVVDALLDDEELNALAERVRERKLTKAGEPNAAVVVVQGKTKGTLRMVGEAYAVKRVRAALVNTALKWQQFALEDA